MKKVIAIFKRDLKRILHNPVALIVTIGVCIIPSLYAWFNIAANWDPYKNTQDIPIAIVDLDEGTQTESKGFICAGDLVCKELDKNRQLDWNFVEEKPAVEGVRSGAYYAAIVIPKDFSADLASILTGNIKKPHLVYYVNEKKNAIAPKVTDTGASTIEEKINAEFVKTVTDVVAQKLEGLQTKVADDTSSTKSEIDTALIATKTTVENLEKLVDKTNEGLTSAHSAISDASSELDKLDSKSFTIQSDLMDASQTFTDTRYSANTLWGKLNSAMISGATGLSSSAIEANGHIAQAYNEVVLASIKIQNTIDQLKTIAQDKQNIIDDIQAISDQLNNPELLEKKIASLTSQLESLNQTIATLQEHKDSLDAKAKTIMNLSDAITNATTTSSQNVLDLQDELNSTSIPHLNSALDGFSDVAATLSANIDSVHPAIQSAQAVLSQLDTTLTQAENSCISTKDSLLGVEDILQGAADDLGVIESSEVYRNLTQTIKVDRETLADFMSSPVKIKEDVVFPVRNYGSGVTPFYTNLALWVGGFVLVAIYKLEVDEEGIGTYKPWQGYFGRWLLLNLLGQIQAVVCCTGDLVMGIQCLNPIAFIIAGMITSFVYINIIYSLSVAFKHIGKALGVLLVILQIPGSSGMYPIEMMPRFFQNLYPWLPFTYGINAMREALAGFYQNYYAYNLKMLLIFVIPSLIVGVTLRRHLLNLNSLFDRKLAETDMMISERVGINDVHFRLSTVLKATLNQAGYKEVFLERAAHFELLYPTLIKRGFVLLFVIPIGLLILVFTSEDKLSMLILWIVSIIIIFTFLIVVEFLHERVNEKTDLADMSQDELYQLLGQQLKQEWMAFAPLEKILHAKSAEDAKSTAEAVIKAKREERRAHEVKAAEIVASIKKDQE